MAPSCRPRGRALALALALRLTLMFAAAQDAAQETFDPDVDLNTPQTIRRYGYAAEAHVVQTADGYLLTLHRIPGPRLSHNASEGPAPSASPAPAPGAGTTPTPTQTTDAAGGPRRPTSAAPPAGTEAPTGAGSPATSATPGPSWTAEGASESDSAAPDPTSTLRPTTLTPAATTPSGPQPASTTSPTASTTEPPYTTTKSPPTTTSSSPSNTTTMTSPTTTSSPPSNTTTKSPATTTSSPPSNTTTMTSPTTTSSPPSNTTTESPATTTSIPPSNTTTMTSPTTTSSPPSNTTTVTSPTTTSSLPSNTTTKSPTTTSVPFTTTFVPFTTTNSFTTTSVPPTTTTSIPSTTTTTTTPTTTPTPTTTTTTTTIPTSTPPPTSRPVIFLQHGLLGSSYDWIVAGPEKGLAYLLAEAGYDVWMGNARGNTYSRAHVYLPTESSSPFWDFSFHEMGIYDLPAVIDYILNTTGAPQLHYVGHSMGTTMFFVMASTKPEAAAGVASMHALAPVVYVKHLKSPIRLLAPFARDVQFLAGLLGDGEFLPQNKILHYLAKYGCELLETEKDVCENLIFILCGYDKPQFNSSILPVLLSHTPAGASTRTVIHYAQMIKSGKFQQYDLGKYGNLKKYRSLEPPTYDLSKVNVSVHLIYANNDWLAAPLDVNSLYQDLHCTKTKYMVPLSSFNHLDFILAKDVKTLLYDKLLKEIPRDIDYQIYEDNFLYD